MLAGLCTGLFPPLAALHLPAGGDHPVHLSRAVFLSTRLWPSLQGWCGDFYLGFPYGSFYPVGGELLVSVVRAATLGAIPWPAAYALALLAAMALPPFGLFLLLRPRVPAPAAWLAALILAVEPGVPWEGGFEFALVAGVWPYWACVGAALVALHALDRCAQRPDGRAIAAAALAVAVALLFHPAVLLFLPAMAAGLALATVAQRRDAGWVGSGSGSGSGSGAGSGSGSGAGSGAGSGSRSGLGGRVRLIGRAALACGAAVALALGLHAWFLVPTFAYAELTDPQGLPARPLAELLDALLALRPFHGLPPEVAVLAAMSLAGTALSRDRGRLLLAGVLVAALGLATAEAAPLFGGEERAVYLQLPRLAGLARVVFLGLAADGLWLVARAAVLLAATARQRLFAPGARIAAAVALAALLAPGAYLLPEAASGLAGWLGRARSIQAYSDEHGPWRELQDALAIVRAREQQRGLPPGRVAFRDGSYYHLSGAVPALTGRPVLRDAWTPTIAVRGRFVDTDPPLLRSLGVTHLVTRIPDGHGPLVQVGAAGGFRVLEDPAPRAPPLVVGGTAEVTVEGSSPGRFQLEVARADAGAVLVLPVAPDPRFGARTSDGTRIELGRAPLVPGRIPEGVAVPLRPGTILVEWTPGAPESWGVAITVPAVIAWLLAFVRRRRESVKKSSLFTDSQAKPEGRSNEKEGGFSRAKRA